RLEENRLLAEWRLRPLSVEANKEILVCSSTAVLALDSMSTETHWQQVYSDKQPTEVSWYQPRPDVSLRLIESTGLAVGAALIDVGGGASTLVDGLLTTGYRDITVLDISAAGMAAARHRL